MKIKKVLYILAFVLIAATMIFVPLNFKKQPPYTVAVTKFNENGAEIWLYDENFVNGYPIVIRDGFNLHPSFNQNGSGTEFIFSHMDNNDSASELWIYKDGFSSNPILVDGKTIDCDTADWGNNGKIACSTADNALYTLNPDGTEFTPTGIYCTAPDWSQDSSLIACSSLGGFLRIFETETWTHARDIVDIPMRAPSFSFDTAMICGDSSEGCYAFDGSRQYFDYPEFSGIVFAKQGIMLVNSNNITLPAKNIVLNSDESSLFSDFADILNK